MISFVQGSLFDSKAEALVNAVNCVGVMGKGIAAEFKRRFPRMYEQYVARCAKWEVRLGEMTWFRDGERLIISFPTKGHWRERSQLYDVKRGLRALRAALVANQVRSVAIPALGCGNGGLNWEDVKQAIQEELGGLEMVHIEVYEPLLGPANKEKRS